MTNEGFPRLSLTAQFDDLCRHSKEISNGCEKEFVNFVKSECGLLKQFKEAQVDIKELKNQLNSLKTEHSQCEHRMKHIRHLLSEEVVRRQELELEKNILLRQVVLIKEILLEDGTAFNDETKDKLIYLSQAVSKLNIDAGLDERQNAVNYSNESLLSSSEMDETRDFDETDDKTVFLRKRPSETNLLSYNGCTPQKKNRVEKYLDGEVRNSNNSMFKKEKEYPGQVNSKLHSAKVPSSELVMSEVATDSAKVRISSSESEMLNSSRLSIEVVMTSTPLHAFSSKRVVLSDKCHACGPVKFSSQVLKCGKCGVTCHPRCKEKCPSQCSPKPSSPSRTSSGTISDYTTSSSPMIPPIIRRCITEIETRGLSHTGIYRKPGRKSEVKLLKERLLKGKKPHLKKDCIYVVCGALKEFLQSLTDPLIPRSQWKAFVKAAEEKVDDISNDLLCAALHSLPQPNRETLALLIPHLQRVAASPYCKMPIENLAMVFGPTVVSYSSAEPTSENILSETIQQINVMHRLLEVPLDFWKKISHPESSENSTLSHVKPPAFIPARKTGKLGPLCVVVNRRKKSFICRVNKE